MSILKIVALLSTIFSTQASVIAPLSSAIHYTRVAPPSVLPFSAQVSTFTRNLHVFDAPYAAGVLPGTPAIIQRALPFVPHAHHVHPGAAVLAPRAVAPAVAGFPLHAASGVLGRSVAPAAVLPFGHHHHYQAALLG